MTPATGSHPDSAAIAAWFEQRLDSAWSKSAAGAPRITVDREEIVVLIGVESPAVEPPSDAHSDAHSDSRSDGGPMRNEAVAAEAVAGAVAKFRADTRDRRIDIAREAEHRFQRKVAWGVYVGDHTELFTHLAVPVMSRLRQPERQVLDTLVDAGVARSRAHALAWCVQLVGRNTDTWLSDLRAAMESVERIRATGPTPAHKDGAE
jgi:hypothetical protein